MPSKYCPDCGNEIDASVKFCPECGTDVSHVGADNKPSDQTEEQDDSSLGGSRVLKTIAYVAGVFLLLIGAAAATVSIPAAFILLGVGVFALPFTRSKLAGSQGVSITGGKAAIIVVIVAVIGMGVLGASVPDQAGDANNAGGDGNGAGSSSDSTPTPSPLTHSIGETFTVGSGGQSIEYTVSSAEEYDTIGSGMLAEEADGVFVVVEMEMTNVADESVDISSNMYTLVDSEDRQYETDTQAMTRAEDSVVFEQLDPGVTKRGVVIYDVPTDQIGRQLRVEPAGALSGADEHSVELE
jgi:RNA polymerase subunit RPABC4/transcription elongation factor Spt4